MPLYTIEEVLRLTPEALAGALIKPGLATVQFDATACCIKSGALYAYYRQALASLLAGDERLSLLPAKSLSCSIACGLTAQNFGSDRRLQHELRQPKIPILAGSSHADDGMDEADYDCCASSASQSKALQTLIPCMRAAAPNETEPPDCEEKREPRERSGHRGQKDRA